MKHPLLLLQIFYTVTDIRGEAIIISHLRFSSNEVASHVKQLPFRPLLLLLLYLIAVFRWMLVPEYTVIESVEGGVRLDTAEVVTIQRLENTQRLTDDGT